MPKIIEFQRTTPREADGCTVRAPVRLMGAMVLFFLLSLPFLNASYTVRGPVYAASVTGTTIFTLLAAVFLCAQYYVERRPLWRMLAYAYVFQAVVSVIWMVGYPMLTLSPVFDQDRARMLVWLWICRNAVVPGLLLVGLLVDARSSRPTPTTQASHPTYPTQRRSVPAPLHARPGRTTQVNDDTSIAVLAWPVLAGFVAFFGFSALSHWLPATITIPATTPAGHMLTAALALLHLAVMWVVIRRRYPDKVIAFVVAFVSLAQALKMLSIVVLSPDAVYGWYMVGAWALVGPLAVTGALLWRGAESLRAARNENRELAEIASTDPLTKLFNRVYFDRGLAQYTAARVGFALLLLDVDYFKSINDRFGHLVGDDVLREIAKVVGPCIRSGDDFVARIGGEEFAVVLVGADEAAASRVGERIRVAIESHRDFAPALEANTLSLTVSIGIATTPAGEAADALMLLDAADRALYRSKAGGRNQVTVAPAVHRGADFASMRMPDAARAASPAAGVAAVASDVGAGGVVTGIAVGTAPGAAIAGLGPLIEPANDPIDAAAIAVHAAAAADDSVIGSVGV